MISFPCSCVFFRTDARVLGRRVGLHVIAVGDFRFRFSLFTFGVICVLASSAFRVAFSCPVRNLFREKFTVFRGSVLGFGVSRLTVFCRRGMVSFVCARRFLLVLCCDHAFVGFLDVALTETFVLAVVRSLGLVTFDFGLFTFLFRGLSVRRS